jgi:hypothetical protein
MITMPGVQDQMDHRTVDVKGKRRFVPANDEELFGNSPLPKRGNPMSVK